MPKRKSPEGGTVNQVYHHSLRWSVPHTEDNRLMLLDMLRTKSDKFIFQAEYTENNPHYQGYFHTKQAIRSRTLAVELNDSLRGIEISPSSTNGLTALKDYCLKEQTRVAGPWADRKIYMGADLWPQEKHPPWQKALFKLLTGPPGDRFMYWIYDPVGNNGKTKFIKWLVYKHKALGLGYGHSTDVLNLVSKFQGRDIYCWNLTRAKPASLSEMDLYAAMESVKDGFFINTKYETDQILMDPPHVVVCANHIPKFNEISHDRWKIFRIHDEGLSQVSQNP